MKQLTISDRIEAMSSIMVGELLRREVTNELVAYGSRKINSTLKCVLSEYTSDTLGRYDEHIVRVLDALVGENSKGAWKAVLSYKMPVLGNAVTEYQKVQAQENLASAIIEAVISLGWVQVNEKVIDEVTSTGKKIYRTVTYLDFGGEKLAKNLTKGLFIGDEPVLFDKYYHVKPGAKQYKLNSNQKSFMKGLGEMKFRLAPELTEELLRDYYQQTEWYKNTLAGKSKNAEDPIILKMRVETYIKTIMSMKGKPLHLANWLDARCRLYYSLTMLGINPHGDAFESAVWESYDAEVLNEEGMGELKLVMVQKALHSRLAKKNAVLLFDKRTEEVIAKFKALDDDFGENFYNKRLLQAYYDGLAGKPSHFLVGLDATSGGLQHGGLAFHSETMATLANVAGKVLGQDPHQMVADAFTLTRVQAKKVIAQLVMHGAAMKTVAERINEATGRSLTEKDVEEYVVKAYGKEILNVIEIAQTGTRLYDSYNSSLLWTAPDGWPAQSTCYFPAAAKEIFSLCSRVKQGYTQTTIYRDMPYAVNAKGAPLHDKPKARGLYANITHSIDSWVLRCAARALMAIGSIALFKHDKFYVLPNKMKLVRETYHSCLLMEYDENLYAKAVEEIKERRDGDASKVVINILQGELTKEQVIKSDKFLSA